MISTKLGRTYSKMADIWSRYMIFLVNIILPLACLSAGTTPGHYVIEQGRFMKILSEDLISAFETNNRVPIWTFNTAENLRIRFSFQDFDFYRDDNISDLLDFGDGSNIGDSTRLATFGGRDLPSNVTSICNAAWVKMSELWYWRSLAGHAAVELNMTVTVIPIEATITTLMGGETLTINHMHSSKNEYRLWDFRAPAEYFISILNGEIELRSPWDDTTLFAFGENTNDTHNSSENEDSCSSLTRLNDDSGQFNPIYKIVASRGSSALLLFSTFSTEARFSFEIRTILLQDNYSINETSNVTLTSDNIFRTIFYDGSCPTFPTWTFTTTVYMELRVTFQIFLFYDPNEFLEIGDGLTVGKDMLAHFSGTDLPGDVVAVSNSAWLAVQVNCGNTDARFNLTATARNKTEMCVQQQEIMTINSSRNAYQYSNIQVPTDSVVSLLFADIETSSFWDNFTYLRVDDIDERNSHNIDSCLPSANLINSNGQFKIKYTKFTSRSSSLKIVFFSTTAQYKMTIAINAMKVKDIGQLWIDHNSRIHISPDDFVKTMSCAEDCLTWRALIFQAPDDIKVRIIFQEFDFNDFQEYLEIGDGSVIGDDTRLVRFSGDTLPSNVTSVSNGAWMNVEFPCGRRSPRILITLIGVNVPGTIHLSRDVELQSPNFPLDYPNNAYTIWNVEAPHGFYIGVMVNFGLFDMQKNADFLHIGDGVDNFRLNSADWIHFTGQTRDIWGRIPFQSVTRFVTIIFTSDGSSVGQGFSIECYLIDSNKEEISAGTTTNISSLLTFKDVGSTRIISTNTHVKHQTPIFLLMVTVFSALIIFVLLTFILGWIYFRCGRCKKIPVNTGTVSSLSSNEPSKSSDDCYERIQYVHRSISKTEKDHATSLKTDNFLHEQRGDEDIDEIVLDSSPKSSMIVTELSEDLTQDDGDSQGITSAETEKSCYPNVCIEECLVCSSDDEGSFSLSIPSNNTDTECASYVNVNPQHRLDLDKHELDDTPNGDHDFNQGIKKGLGNIDAVADTMKAEESKALYEVVLMSNQELQGTSL